MEKNKNIYRILDKNNKVKFTGSNIGSWFSLQDAKSKVNYKQGEKIFQYTEDFQRKLFEVL